MILHCVKPESFGVHPVGKKERKKPHEAVFAARFTYFHEYLLILGLIFFDGSFLKETLFGDLKTELCLWSPHAAFWEQAN